MRSLLPHPALRLAACLATCFPPLACGAPPTSTAAAPSLEARVAPAGGAGPTIAGPLAPPAWGKIRVAFAISKGSNVIDMSGPWEVFQDADVSRSFELYTVAASRDPVRLTGGLQVVPDYAFAEAPQPNVVVVPAMRGSAELHDWLRRVAPRADLVMSVCTGAFQLAAAGLLDGRAVTTHHDFWDDFARRHPQVELLRGPRFVEAGDHLATAGGLTSGIDLALRVVERYHGTEAARRTAAYMEYRGVPRE